MEGPFDYDADTVDANVEPGRIGNYALGTAGKKRNLGIVGYVGRSDTDLRAEIKSYIGKRIHPHFKFSYANSAEEAYLKECLNFHDFGMEKKGQIHPAKPAGSRTKCPVCGD